LQHNNEGVRVPGRLSVWIAFYFCCVFGFVISIHFSPFSDIFRRIAKQVSTKHTQQSTVFNKRRSTINSFQQKLLIVAKQSTKTVDCRQTINNRKLSFNSFLPSINSFCGYPEYRS
jgi:hypothetical protein